MGFRRLALAPAVLAAPFASAQELFRTPVYVPGSAGGAFRTHGDFDGDGDEDLLHTAGPAGFAFPQEMSVFTNDGAGNFAQRVVVPFSPPGGANVARRRRRDYLVPEWFLPSPFSATFVEMHLLRDDGVGGYADAGPAAAPDIEIDAVRPGDADGDGDLDLLGRDLLRGRRVPAPEGGLTRQFGAGSPGTGGVVPVLGAQGPVTSANPDAGELALALPQIPALFGVEVFQQAFVADPGPFFGFSSTNGLAITFGL